LLNTYRTVAVDPIFANLLVDGESRSRLIGTVFKTLTSGG
jgi:hypothetical protein